MKTWSSRRPDHVGEHRRAHDPRTLKAFDKARAYLDKASARLAGNYDPDASRIASQIRELSMKLYDLTHPDHPYPRSRL